MTGERVSADVDHAFDHRRSAPWDWVVLAVVAPVFLYPAPFPRLAVLLALAALPALWTSRTLLGSGVRTARSPLTLLVAGVVGMAALAAWRSPVPAVSGPRALGLVLGLLLYQTILTRMAHGDRLRWSVAALLVIVTGTVIVGGLGAIWSQSDRFPILAAYTQRSVSPIYRVPGTTSEGVNPNAVAVTTLYMLPIGAALLASRRPTGSRAGSRRLGVGPFSKSVIAILVMVNGLILIMTQSRLAWLGMAAALPCLLLLLRRPVYAVAFLTVLVIGVGRLYMLTLEPRYHYRGGDVMSSVTSRTPIWARALRGINEAPLAGIGLNAFRERVDSFDLPDSRASAAPGTEVTGLTVPHAHNIFLQTALDLGLPGLIVYLALLLVALTLCADIFRRAESPDKALAIGLAGSLVAQHIFGLADAVSLGAKVGIFFWWNLGLIAGLHWRTRCADFAHGRLSDAAYV